MSATRQPPSNGEALPATETQIIRELVALERLRIESRERLELAQLRMHAEEMSSADTRHTAFTSALNEVARALSPLAEVLASKVRITTVPPNYYPPAPGPQAAPAPAPSAPTAEPSPKTTNGIAHAHATNGAAAI